MVQPPICDGPRQRSCQPHSFSNKAADRSGSETVMLACSSRARVMTKIPSASGCFPLPRRVRDGLFESPGLPLVQPQANLRSNENDTRAGRMALHRDDWITIGTLAKRTGVAVSAIRYYE